MKINELKELRKKDVKDLIKLMSEKAKKLTRVRVDIRAGREKNLKLSKTLSDEIAKILTLVRESELTAKVLKVDKTKETKK